MDRLIPASWMPICKMRAIAGHWSAGSHKVSPIDREHYHIIIGGDGKPVLGDHPITDNVSTADDDYAAHTRGFNTGVIGLSMACMLNAKESPFSAGPYPMLREQWDIFVRVTAELCKAYGIPITPKTVLSHAEVQPTLGIQQAGKWDFTRLAFDPSVTGHKACGDKWRKEAAAVLAQL